MHIHSQWPTLSESISKTDIMLHAAWNVINGRMNNNARVLSAFKGFECFQGEQAKTWDKYFTETGLHSMVFFAKKNHENRTWIIDTFITTFITNNFISNIRLKLTKNQAKAEQHPEPELLLFDNCLLSSWTLSSKIGHILNNVQWNRCVYFQD